MSKRTGTAGSEWDAPASFDRIARAYRWMEYLSFGPCLWRCRVARLGSMRGHRRALVLGDGDGRFLARLLREAPHLSITAVDASRSMLQAAARRLPEKHPVTMLHEDALMLPSAALGAPFDLLVTHFFLDCFRQQELEQVIGRVTAASAADARWVISEFAPPPGRVSGALGRLLIRSLYAAFGWLTGLKARRLPDYASALRQRGWTLEDRRLLLRGLLVSESWRRTKPMANADDSIRPEQRG